MLKHTPLKWLKLSLLILFLAAINIYPQSQKVSYKILGISVVGNKSADASTIIANAGFKTGEVISIPGDQTNNAIKRLWTLGIFEDIQILIEKNVADGIFLQLKVKEFPRLEKVVLIGNDELSEDNINKKISMVKGQTLKPYEVIRDINKIKKLYEDDGYLNASIEPHYYNFFRADTVDKEVSITWRDDKDLSKEYKTTYENGKVSTINTVPRIKERTLLILKINEGDEITVKNIYFKGNNKFEDGALKGEFDDTKEGRWWKFWSSAKFKREKFEKDKELLTKFYRKNGYRDFMVLHDSLIFSSDKKHVDLIVTVFEGNQYKIRNIYWEGNTVYPNEALSERLDIKKGEIYDYEKFNQNLHYNEKQTDVSSLFQDSGYLGFQVDTKEEKVADDSVDIRIKITEGNRFKIGKVDITGNDKTKDKVIRRELYTVPGNYFSRSFILRSIQQLANLQYFNAEDLYKTGVDYRPANDSTVNIIYKVEEKSSDYLNASVGYSGSFGFSGALGFTLSNFSMAEPFQMGGGQILNFNWQFGVGNYYRTFTLGFTEPWYNDTPTMVGAELFDTRQNYVYDMSQSGITLKTGRRLTWPDDFFSVQGMFRFQYNDVITGLGYYPQGFTRQYTLGGTISRTDIDNPIFPTRGSKIFLDAELSGGPFLPGNVDYYKIQFKSEWYKPLFKSSKIVLYTSADLGYIGKLEANTPITPFDYFYMGGTGLIIATTSLRGYEDRSLGSKDSLGNVIGSSVMAKFTSEIRFAVTMEPIPIYILAFAEAGNVYFDLKQTDLFDLKRSVGIGARIQLNPIGLIGFDYGYGFDRKSVDGQSPQWVFHFQFGKGF
jgi:outer membrane protein insertion porin family